MKGFLTIAIVLIALQLLAQKHTISGYVSDATTGEKLINASVYDDISKKGTITNEYGFYSLTLNEGSIELISSFVGFQSIKRIVNLNGNLTINFAMKSSLELSEVTIRAERKDNIVKDSKMSVLEVPIVAITSLPVLFGEVDIMKTIQLLPGIKSGGEGTSGLYVRGGGPDQNLILLDGVPVYNADHLFGFFSVFNADAIKGISIYKGGFPARYGGRISSVLDIRMKEGNNQEFAGKISIGLIASKFTLEGPIIKDKTSFIVSGRRTYIDILAQPLIRMAANSGGMKFNAGYYFYDLNAKINHKFSEKSHLYLSSYMGNDKAYFRTKYNYYLSETDYEEKINMDLGWGNITSALRWNYQYNNKLFSNFTATYSQYLFDVNQNYEVKENYQNVSQTISNKIRFFSGINDVSGKIDYDYYPSPNHAVKFGAANIYHTFNPGINHWKYSVFIDTTFGSSRIYANEWYAYAEDDINIGARIKTNIGLHYSGFFVKGKYYHSLQPRISSRFLCNEKWSIKASYSEMTQYIHLLTTAKIGLPTDLWLPVTDIIPPQKSTQYAVSSVHQVKDFELSIEAYYKKMNNLLEYKEGLGVFMQTLDWQYKVEIGQGWAYGAEFLIRKDVGKTQGWIGYTLSWTNRQFENLNFGEVFPYRYDRRHDIGIALKHKYNEKIDFGLVWVYGTGNAVTLATERYQGFSHPNSYNDDYYYYNSQEIEHYPSRNGFRVPSYHRLDISINFSKEKKYGTRIISLGIYNVYNRKNPFFLTFEYDYRGNKVLTQYSLFPLIPSISYSIQFGKNSSISNNLPE
jgi:hypothetical protein